jgi:molecular chaperone IbpA
MLLNGGYVAMTRYDFSPLFRSTVGFDRMMNLLESAPQVAEATSYPPYNIEKLDDDSYQITMAVAGFGADDIEIESREDVLFVSGKVKETGTDGNYLHRGIAGRSFKRSFQLADHVKVTGARLENGLLHIDLKREIPEEKKPRKIEIQSSGAKTVASKLVDESDKAAA